MPRHKDVILLADLIDQARPGEEIEVRAGEALRNSEKSCGDSRASNAAARDESGRVLSR